MLFTQNNLIFPLCNYGASIGNVLSLDSFNMKNYNHATIIMQFASVLGTATVATLVMHTGSSDGGIATGGDATFHYRLNSASTANNASADKLAADATASTLTLTAATYAGYTLILEIDADELPTASKTYEWVTVTASGGTASGGVAAFAILSEPRYADSVMNTALA